MNMERRNYLSAVGVVATTLLSAGCLGDEETGTLATGISDDSHSAISDFERLVVTVDTIRAFPREEDDPVEIDADGAEVDLVSVQGESYDLVAESELPAGSYSRLQLRVQDDVDAALTDGTEDITVTTPGNAPLQFNHEFEIRPDESTMFIADFAPFSGGPQDYQIRPVPEEIRVVYGEDSVPPQNPETEPDSNDTNESPNPRHDPDRDDADHRLPGPGGNEREERERRDDDDDGDDTER